MNSGFCIVTFNNHTSCVTDICFIGNGHALLSSSLDGTVRCYDTIRYRNFRTFVAPEPVQFSCVNCDSAGEIVAAGTFDKFLIYIWSLQTSKLLDILEGVEGPISSLKFSPNSTQLAASSWDKALYVWDVVKPKEPRVYIIYILLLFRIFLFFTFFLFSFSLNLLFFFFFYINFNFMIFYSKLMIIPPMFYV